VWDSSCGAATLSGQLDTAGTDATDGATKIVFTTPTMADGSCKST